MDATLDGAAFAAGQAAHDQAGRRYEAKMEGGGFWMREGGLGEQAGSSGAWCQVVGVIGETPLRQYLSPLPGGRLQARSLAWDSERQEWFDVFGGETRRPGDWGHWTGQGMNWNANCAYCHMTDFRKRFDFRADAYASVWTAHGVACAQCHGAVGDGHPGESRQAAPDAARRAMDSCASCHARRADLASEGLRPGDRFEDRYRLALADEPGAYFGNGLSREENFEYGPFMLSAMGEKGLSCLDCHDPHSGQARLAAEGNALCLSCHATGARGAAVVDAIAHSRHRPGSPGDRCVECHMPRRAYMDRDHRRDHGFTIPDPLSTVERGEPNACGQCHGDQPAEWVLDRFQAWGPATARLQRQRARGEAIAAGREGAPGAAGRLVQLWRTEANPHWRATYLRLLAGAPVEPAVEAVLRSAASSVHAIEREAALMALGGQATVADLEAGLADDARLVRLRAARGLGPALDRSSPVFAEYLDFVEGNADRPEGALLRAELAAADGDAGLARQLALKAVSLDPGAALVAVDAAVALARVGDLDTALGALAAARKRSPEVAAVPYAMGLLRAGQGEPGRAAQLLEEALALAPGDARWWRNLAVAYQMVGDMDRARSRLEEAISRDPGNPEYQELRRSWAAPGEAP